MELRRSFRAILLGILLGFLVQEHAIIMGTTALQKDQTPPAVALEAVSATVDSIIQHMGWSKDQVNLGRIDTRDARLGQTLIYEFDIRVGDVIIPLRLSEDITSWQYLDELPGSGSENLEAGEEEKGAINVWRPEAFTAVLAPFQVAGPVDLWIQDAEELRLLMPHDVDAGKLKKVVLADGAVVTVKGAREVSLSRLLQLPLPLVQIPEGKGLAASLIALASRLRSMSLGHSMQLLSLRIVGPTSLTAAAAAPTKEASEPDGATRLKVKRLGSGAVELTSQSGNQEVVADRPGASGGALVHLGDGVGEEEAWMWPLPLLNMSKLQALEQALIKTLGPSVYKKGSFQLLKAKVSAASFVQMQFELEKKVTEEESLSSFSSEAEELWPDWATKPSVERLEFELLAKVEGERLIPIRAQHLEPVLPTIAISPAAADMEGNFTMKSPPILPPPGAMTLNVNWEGIMD